MKYVKFIMLAVGFSALLASCQCKTCKKTGELQYTFCKDGGSQTNYDQTIAAYETYGYTCQ